MTTKQTTAASGTAGAALVLSWAARTMGVDMPIEVALIIAGGLAWLAYRLTDRKGRYERTE